MKTGVLEVTDRRARPDGPGVAFWRVRCRCCAVQLGNPGARRNAREELKAAGWKFDRSRGGWHCNVCARPKIAHVEGRRYRVEGGALSADWSRSFVQYLKRERAAGREVPTGPPWCEVTIDLEDERAIVASFGGAVWPGAWPDLFTVSPQRPDGDGSTRLTALGLRRFREVTR